MKFTRVNKDTVNCIITEDDMDEQGIKLEDLFQKNDEAMEFLHEVMERAVEEVDYKPVGEFTPMQITVLPDHSISLTLSENMDGAFADMLKNITEKAGLKLPTDFLEELGDVSEEERIPKLSEYLQNLKDFSNSVRDMAKKAGIDAGSEDEGDTLTVKSKDSGRKTREADDISAPVIGNIDAPEFGSFVFEFDSFRTVMDLAMRMPEGIRMSTTLYKKSSSGKHYMLFNREDEKAKKIASVFSICYEYGRFVTARDMAILHMDENYDIVLKDNALEVLRSL